MAVSSIVRNVLGVPVVYFALCGMFLATPVQPPVAEILLECRDAGTVAIFPTVSACVADARYKAGCACAAPSNPRKWFEWWYMLGLVPVITTAIGYALLRGSLFGRLLLLNAAVGTGLLTESVRTGKNMAPRVLPDDPALLLGLCASFSVLFVMFHFLQHALVRNNSARVDPS